MSEKSQPTSKSLDDCWRMVVKWVTLLAVHYRVQITDPEIRIYYDGLREYSAKRLDEAFFLCRRECEFMPRVVDVIKRLPEGEYSTGNGLREDGVFIPISDHMESFSRTHNLRVYLNSVGAKKVKLEPILAGEFPVRGTVVSPSEAISWDEAWKRIVELAKDKDLSRAIRSKPTIPASDVTYIPTVNGKPMREWALEQNLKDALPRSQQEIGFIKSVQNYGKPKQKRSAP